MATVYRNYRQVLTQTDSLLTTVTNVNNRIATSQLILGSLNLSAADGDLCNVEVSVVVIGSGEAQRIPVSITNGMGDGLRCN